MYQDFLSNVGHNWESHIKSLGDDGSKNTTPITRLSVDVAECMKRSHTLLKPSIEFLNLMNIIIPSSFSPNYYQYLKLDKKKKEKEHPNNAHNHHRLDWILNEDDGDGNDGNLN